MSPRIETAEILSFRLKVPAHELRRLPAALAGEVSLSVEEDGAETVVSVADSDSYLRFRPIGAEAILTEVFLCNDLGGVFFERVLAGMMVRFQGDLHARLTWSHPDRNRHGEYAEVRIEKGRAAGQGAPSPAASASLGAQEDAASDEAEEEVEEAEAPTPLEAEVRESLARARAHWAEYQRLKAKKG